MTLLAGSRTRTTSSVLALDEHALGQRAAEVVQLLEQPAEAA